MDRIRQLLKDIGSGSNLAGSVLHGDPQGREELRGIAGIASGHLCDLLRQILQRILQILWGCACMRCGEAPLLKLHGRDAEARGHLVEAVASLSEPRHRRLKAEAYCSGYGRKRRAYRLSNALRLARKVLDRSLSKLELSVEVIEFSRVDRRLETLPLLRGDGQDGRHRIAHRQNSGQPEILIRH